MAGLFWSLPAAALGSLLSWLAPVPSIPADHEGLCRSEAFGGVEYLVCDVPLEGYRLSLLALDGDGRAFETFERADAASRALGSGSLLLAMNAGMYHPDRRPVGLAIQGGEEVSPAVLGTGSGNYSLRPNGVFFVEDGRARVVESERFLRSGSAPEIATQSGPMLLIDGALHPRFIENSDSRHVRNGVCATEEGRIVHLVMSRNPVNFWDFAVFFRDGLGCSDALFFDGEVSSLYYPALGIDHRRDRLGPILAVTAQD